MHNQESLSYEYYVLSVELLIAPYFNSFRDLGNNFEGRRALFCLHFTKNGATKIERSKICIIMITFYNELFSTLFFCIYSVS